MANVTKPMLLDETGQAIVNKLEAIKNAIGPVASSIPQTAISGVGNVDAALGYLDDKIDNADSDVVNALVSSVKAAMDRWLRFNPSNKKGLILKAGTYIRKQDGTIWHNTADVALDFSSVLSTSTNGKDYGVYLYNDDTFGILTVNNATPANAVKIGRFHTLCVAAGTINMTCSAQPSSGLSAGGKYLVKPYDENEDPDFYAFYNKTIVSVTVQSAYDVVTCNHPLSGYAAGDILPESVFCLTFKPDTLFEDAMVYDKCYDRVIDVYLQSGTGMNTRSAYNATHTVSRTPYNHQDDMRLVGKRLLEDDEFTSAANGSNEKTAIQGAADKTYVGGHVDTASRRMISAIGCEEMCGYLWQWCRNIASKGGSGFVTTDTHASFGQEYGEPYVLLAGGYWSDSSSCGSRARRSSGVRSGVFANSGGRGSSRVKRCA